MTYMQKDEIKLIPPHGGYRNLKSYQTAIIIYDLTPIFCERFLDDRTNKTYKSYTPYRSRTPDQMIQSARSGCANLAEGSQDSATSKKMEIKLVGVARGCLEELLFDCESFLRQRGLLIWKKDDPRALEIRSLSYGSDRTYKTYLKYFNDQESAANCLICLIHQANFLIDRQLLSLEREFLKKGGFSENLFKKRLEYRKSK